MEPISTCSRGAQKEVGIQYYPHFSYKHLLQMVSKSYCFTINDGEPFPFDDVTMQYLVYQKERGEEKQHDHYQGYVRFITNKRLTGCKKIHATAHWEVAKGSPEQNKAYCTKDETRIEGPWEFGIFPIQGKRTDLSDVITAVREKRPREEYIYTDAYVKYYKGIEHVKLMSTQPLQTEDVRGTWIYGPPGVGKSHHVRKNYPNVFIKQQNKWWDGYDQQETVLIDDFDRNGVCLGHYLKIWADKWAATGEFKGGTLNLLYTKFFITSNYSIDELFYEDSVLCAAIKRRFKIINLVFQTDSLDI